MNVLHLEEAGRLAKELSVGPVDITVTVAPEGIDVYGTLSENKRRKWHRVYRVKYRDLDAAGDVNPLTEAIVRMNKILLGTRR